MWEPYNAHPTSISHEASVLLVEDSISDIRLSSKVKVNGCMTLEVTGTYAKHNPVSVCSHDEGHVCKDPFDPFRKSKIALAVDHAQFNRHRCETESLLWLYTTGEFERS